MFARELSRDFFLCDSQVVFDAFFHFDSVKRFFCGIPIASVEIPCCDKTSLVSIISSRKKFVATV